MSDGIKDAYEESERLFCNQRIAFYAEKSPEQIYTLLSTLNESMEYFINSNPALTSYQWSRIQDMREIINAFEKKMNITDLAKKAVKNINSMSEQELRDKFIANGYTPTSHSVSKLITYTVNDGNNIREITLEIDTNKPKVYRKDGQYLFNTKLISEKLISK